MTPRRAKVAAALAALLGAASCGEAPPVDAFATAALPGSPQPQPCEQRNALKNAYFGDLHVHTGLSTDAWMFDVRVTPDQAYGYAFGDSVRLPPLDDQGRGTREARIDRPLDFMAVTDHAEFLGESQLCQDPAASGYGSEFCEDFRTAEGRSSKQLRRIFSPFPSRDAEVCGEDGARCDKAVRGAWSQIVDAAQRWQDFTPACRRTTFIAYEYSSHRLGSNLHRNVIFAGSVVPGRPVSYIDAPREWRLWDLLASTCLDAGNGCEVLAIPHNSNISNGRMFSADWPGAWTRAAKAERAALRKRVEPVIEIMQHKGDSECRNGLAGVLGGEDEHCGFERFEDRVLAGLDRGGECYEGPLTDYLPRPGPTCLSRRSYARYVIAEGIRERGQLGVNPYKLGFIAATDTHNGTGGAVAEWNYQGHLGSADDSPDKRLEPRSTVSGNSANNPGGLAGVWAEENSRQAIFDALARREVFGTSGPRIAPRLFAGWNYPAGMCDDPNLLERAYAGGVPMGATLPLGEGEGAAPSFLAMASADPAARDGVRGNLLQTLQIIKVWPDPERPDAVRQRVHNVAEKLPEGSSGVGSDCAPEAGGAAQLCALWRDPEFDPKQSAAYYLRVLESRSCRYTEWQRRSAEREPAQGGRELIRERAWSSPIWYESEG